MANDQENPLLLRWYMGKLPWGVCWKDWPKFPRGEVAQRVLIYFRLDSLVISFFLAEFCNLTYFIEGATQEIICSHSWKVTPFRKGLSWPILARESVLNSRKKRLVFCWWMLSMYTYYLWVFLIVCYMWAKKYSVFGLFCYFKFTYKNFSLRECLCMICGAPVFFIVLTLILSLSSFMLCTCGVCLSNE